MYSSVCSGAVNGMASYIASVEVDVSRGLPGFDMVGKLSNEVKEAKERIKVALKNCGIDIPPVKITVNISPADISKSGVGFDLPIAMGILTSLGQIPKENIEDILIIGELGLMGDVKPVSGVLPIVIKAKEEGKKGCILPVGNIKEASYVKGIDVIPVTDMCEAVSILQNRELLKTMACEMSDYVSDDKYSEDIPDYSDVVGQESCIRAATVAAAGFHHMLITGPPGAGKTMIAKRIRSIMQPLDEAESLEVSTIYSISGMLNEERPYITVRPFIQPHHTATRVTLAGGGMFPRPGAMSLAHKGVLFLDEFPEFNRECIEVLREPLEEKKIQLSRGKATYTYPADFMLVAAANPCPCGHYPDRNQCNCSDGMIARYRSRISGPVKDRIDIIVSASRIDADRMIGSKRNENKRNISSEILREDVRRALNKQQTRYSGTNIRYNSEIPSGHIDDYCALMGEEKEYMKDVYDAMELTARSYHKILKVARTIADLDDDDEIRIKHLAEAVSYRGGL
ncbi:MAG: YifB family Mg chelatase-like AAA ATPase [Lachnospiraceae bacterium]|nr:YifB family Mg chelatase-like AAA ATPase [Lachnospiraceae bacterium]